MSDENRPRPGSIAWTDLTVADAETVRDFYAAVVGWTASPVDMGGYADFTMTPPGGGAPVAGICHARGPNADLPPQWLHYLVVSRLDDSVSACVRLGGQVVVAPKTMGDHGRCCVIRDPAGAVAALFEPA